MVKKNAIAVLACCMLVFGLMLAGCGADKSNYVGEWELASSSDANLDSESIELLHSISPGADLSLKEDGTGFLNLFSNVRDVKWSAQSNTEGTLEVDGAQTSITISDGSLTLADVEGASLTFSRMPH